MDNEISESAKAIQEVAKTTRVGIEATQKLGGFVSRIINEPIENVVGILSDKLKFMRAERQLRLADRWREIVRERGIEGAFRIVPPKIALPIIENASLEENDELQDLWANLLASAADPKFEGMVRSAFIDIIKQLEVIDVHILNFVYRTYIEEKKEMIERYAKKFKLQKYEPPPTDISIANRYICMNLKIAEAVYMNSVDNLIRLRCIASYVESSDVETEEEGTQTFTYFHNYDAVCMTPFGISFVEACTNPVRSNVPSPKQSKT